MKQENNKKTGKLEKADILELTVHHIRNLQNEQRNGGKTGLGDSMTDRLLTPSPSTNADGYDCGFVECAQMVSRVLREWEMSGGVDPLIRARLLGYLQTTRPASTPVQPSTNDDTRHSFTCQMDSNHSSSRSVNQNSDVDDGKFSTTLITDRTSSVWRPW